MNGTLKEFDALDLMNKVMERRESLFTDRTHNGITYYISIHFEDLIGTVTPETKYYIDIVSEDKNRHQERLTTYEEYGDLKNWEVVSKLNEFKESIIH